ncbi:chloride channel protein [Paludibaculum fermentans]|uniref:chloride channel protein n=1 Tax=Paludibaculum fermentans TaxID=1473598 RepID=UPI003EBDC9BF
MLNSIGRWMRQWSERTPGKSGQTQLVLSFVIGAVVGLVVVAFILLTGRLAARMYPPGGAAWRRVLVPVLGALSTGWLLAKYFPGARGSGIPQTKFAIFIHDGYISLKTVLGKFVCCSTSLASGIALGREGPSVQIGAGIASVLGRRCGLQGDDVKALIPVGCSAALAAAFNTPIAAVLFSLEEILGDLHAPVLGSVVISSATSWMVLHMILGDEPLFHVPAYQLVSPIEFVVYAVLGVVGGLASVAFVKLLLGLRIWFRGLPAKTVWLQPAVGGLLVGLLGWYWPEVLGVGYDYVERVLNGDMALRTIALLVVLKIVATAVCYSSGNAGGIFGPSLFIGAMVGGTVGSVAHVLLPGVTANPGAYALIGMGTAFAGIVRTPLTSVIMIFEMTRDYSIIVPLMISNLISFFVSYRLQRQPIYEALAHQEGVSLPSGEERVHQARLSVDDVMEAAAGLTAEELLAVGQSRLEDTAGGGEYPFVHPDHPLSLALEKMGDHHRNMLPVVSRANISQLLGVVRLPAILKAFGVAQEGSR